MNLRSSKYAFLIAGLAIIALFEACRHQTPEPTQEDSPEDLTPYLIGGTGTVFFEDAQAYLHPHSNLTGDQLTQFYQGEALFNLGFEPVGSSPDETPGLGPLFIQNSCNGCHVRNGRSRPPIDADDQFSGVLIRLSISGANKTGGPLGYEGFGTQLQTRGIPGVQAEGKFLLDYVDEVITYPDGSSIVLHQPYINIFDTYSFLPASVLKSARNASPVYGLGLLEAISDEDLLAHVDEQDANGDYISGRANHVWDKLTQSMRIGRFGWKASSPTLIQQSAEAFNQDMGITSAVLFPEENCIGQSNCQEGLTEGPEITIEQAELISLYIRGLAVPARRNIYDPAVIQGEQLFENIGCAGCHIPTWTTGISPWPNLSNQVIHPYTDLLIHDLGEVLGDGRPDFEASANEWRTPPLWGIGLTKTAFPDATFLHDGRAETLEEAIVWHGGEAFWSRNAFMALSSTERAAVIAFLESL